MCIAPLTPDQEAERLSLYQLGLRDGEIAERVGVHRTTIRQWRGDRGLLNNVSRAADARYMPLYERGYTDRAIAREIGVDRVSVRQWRRTRGLPSHKPTDVTLSEEQNAARMMLYSFGYSDRRIAKEQGITATPVLMWRRARGLPPNDARRGVKSTPAKVLDRIRRALPRYLSPADRDDAAGDLYLAVMSGAIPIGEIERRAGKFGNAVADSFSSKWGARSLDEDIGKDGDGFRMIDLVRDDRSSSWLEEMGATVW